MFMRFIVFLYGSACRAAHAGALLALWSAPEMTMARTLFAAVALIRVVVATRIQGRGLADVLRDALSTSSGCPSDEADGARTAG